MDSTAAIACAVHQVFELHHSGYIFGRYFWILCKGSPIESKSVAPSDPHPGRH
jgi:hypothetical protein